MAHITQQVPVLLGSLDREHGAWKYWTADWMLAFLLGQNSLTSALIPLSGPGFIRTEQGENMAWPTLTCPHATQCLVLHIATTALHKDLAVQSLRAHLASVPGRLAASRDMPAWEREIKKGAYKLQLANSIWQGWYTSGETNVHPRHNFFGMRSEHY